MKKLYPHLLNGANWVLASLLTLLGYSCSGVDDNGLLCEYGSPHASYEIKGKVVDNAGKTIPNIQVTISNTAADHSSFYVKDTLTTNAQGEFNISAGLVSFGEDTSFKIKAEDIDGIENGGKFEEVITEVPFKKTDLKEGDGNWNAGNAKKEITITMERDPLVCD